MRSWLIKEMRRYRADQVNSPQKIALLWRNLADAMGVVEASREPGQGVLTEIIDDLYDERSVTVTFAARVRRA